MNPNSTKTTSSANHRRHDDALLLSAINWLCFLLAGMALVAWIGAFPAHSIFFIGLEALIGWASLAALIHNIYFRCQPREQIAGTEEVPERRPGFFASVGQWVLFAIGIAVLARSIYPAAPLASSLTPIPVSILRLAGVVLLVDAVALYFLTNYTAILQKNALGGQLASLLRLCRIVYISCAAACIIIFTFLATTWDFSSALGWFLVSFTLLLCLEPLLRLAVRFYLPKSLRRIPAPVGDSLALDLLFGSRSVLIRITRQFEGLLGLKVADLWIAQFLRQVAEPILLIGLLLGWLSTCVTAVPLDSRGVLVSFGRYSPEALAPGLHYSWPWPMGEIDLVQTERVQELSLGFDKDLAGPMLWTAPHFCRRAKPPRWGWRKPAYSGCPHPIPHLRPGCFSSGDDGRSRSPKEPGVPGINRSRPLARELPDHDGGPGNDGLRTQSEPATADRPNGPWPGDCLRRAKGRPPPGRCGAGL